MRIFWIVLDSAGIGKAPDASQFGDEGSDTWKRCYNSGKLEIPNMKKLGFYNIDEIDYGMPEEVPMGCYGRLHEKSQGKDTTIGHWEMAGMISEKPFPTYPDGFPQDVLDEFTKQTGRGILCNKPYSGTDVIRDFGKEHIETGKLIVYTSADSVFQIAAHEDVIPVEKLYEICKIARKILDDPKYNVGTVIARPFIGDKNENFVRTYNRRDFESNTFGKTMLDVIYNEDKEAQVIAIGKIEDLFSGRGITKAIHTNGNADGIEKTIEYIKQDSKGLIFTNLVDFDMLYGHRNNVKGYSEALEYFDGKLPEIMKNMKDDDMLIITADHGNDPTTPSTDHSREYTPILVYGKQIKSNTNLGIRKTYADISATILDLFNLSKLENGTSFKNEILK